MCNDSPVPNKHHIKNSNALLVLVLWTLGLWSSITRIRAIIKSHSYYKFFTNNPSRELGCQFLRFSWLIWFADDYTKNDNSNASTCCRWEKNSILGCSTSDLKKYTQFTFFLTFYFATYPLIKKNIILELLF